MHFTTDTAELKGSLFIISLNNNASETFNFIYSNIHSPIYTAQPPQPQYSSCNSI